MTTSTGETNPVIEDARGMAARMAAAAAGSMRAVILYGSHLLGANPDRHSALDFVVVVDDYEPFYRGLHDAGELHRAPAVMASLARVLPPNVIAFTPDDGRAGVAKCLVVSTADFEAALGPTPKDHFLLARMVQRVAVIWGRDEDEARWVDDRLTEARNGVLDWLRPWLEEPFDAEDAGRTLLEVCYRAEFRPEARNRAETIFQMQRDHFREQLGPVLDRAVAAGALNAAQGGYRFAATPTRQEHRRWLRHFRRSKLRATARWLKHVVTFDNWLPYIVRKVERRTGRKVELTRLERRLPLIFLWPRAIRVLMSRPEREKHR